VSEADHTEAGLRREDRPRPSHVEAGLRAVTELDSRSLALMRVGLACALLWDMVVTLSVADDWWAMQGYESMPLPAWLIIGTPATTLRLAAGAVVLVSVGLALGWQARWMTAAAWLSACAHHYAGRGTADYHNALMCVLLLWSLALPLGERWSLDARTGRRSTPRPWMWRAGAFGLVVSLAWIYLSTAAAKTGPSWGEGSAVWLALLDRATQTKLGRGVATFPIPLLKLATWFTLAIEWAAPVLILWPRARWLAVGLLTGLHGTTWLLMDLGSFPLAALTAVSVLIPASAWDRVTQHRSSVTSAAPTAPSKSNTVSGSRRRLAVAVLVLQVAAVIITVEGHRIATSGERSPYPGSRQLLRCKYLLGTEARWTMYAPEPFTDTGWWIAIAWTTDGRVIDPITGAEPTTRPPSPDDGSVSLRWLYLSEAPSRVDGVDIHAAYRDFLLTRRNTPASERLALVWMFEPLSPFDAPTQRLPLLSLTWPEKAVTDDQVSAVLQQPVRRPAYDEDGNLVGPDDPLSPSEHSVP
jgi:hypothetical protein